MRPITPEELFQAYRLWLKPPDVARAQKLLDEQQPIKLREARLGLLLSTRAVAERMGIRASSYSKLETHDEHDTISVANLKRAAEALGCDVFIQVRPKDAAGFLELLWAPLYAEALERRCFRTKAPKTRLSGLIADSMHVLFENSAVRKKFGWTFRRVNPRTFWENEQRRAQFKARQIKRRRPKSAPSN